MSDLGDQAGPPPGNDFRDDPDIPPDLRILRRIPPGQVVRDGPDVRPRSDNFRNSPDGSGTSFDLWDGDRTPEDLLDETQQDWAVISVTVEEIRGLGLGVIRWPIDGNDHHVLIQGQKSKSRLRNLAKAVRWDRPFPD